MLTKAKKKKIIHAHGQNSFIEGHSALKTKKSCNKKCLAILPQSLKSQLFMKFAAFGKNKHLKSIDFYCLRQRAGSCASVLEA